MADTAGGTIEADIADLAFNPHHTARFGIAAQELRIEPGVKVIGIVIGRQDVALFGRRRGEFSALGRRPGHAQLVQLRRLAARLRGQPILVQRQEIKVAAIGAERVEIGVVLLAPVDELDPQLEAALRGGNEVILGNAQCFVEGADRRDRRLTHPDRADLFTFDQRNAAASADCIGERGSGHPAGGAATNNHY